MSMKCYNSVIEFNNIFCYVNFKIFFLFSTLRDSFKNDVHHFLVIFTPIPLVRFHPDLHLTLIDVFLIPSFFPACFFKHTVDKYNTPSTIEFRPGLSNHILPSRRHNFWMIPYGYITQNTLGDVYTFHPHVQFFWSLKSF